MKLELKPLPRIAPLLRAIATEVAERTLERGASMRRPVLGDSVR